ncbi:MAG: Bax inhibitor-1/YccA family protein [Alphaproteobacteria bacterium]|nr:Bax inhibitor-1/YccA family protein [Alphaproteobacteria bacterium]
MDLNETKRNSSFLEGTKKSQGFSLVNEGLRSYLMQVYKLMGLGLLVSALTAFLGTTPLFFNLLFTQTPQGIDFSILGIIVMIAPLILVFMFGSAVRKINPTKAQAIFWIFSALTGFSFSAILLAFTAESLFQTFIITSGSFGALCLYGYTTKRDLTGLGAFMHMGLWGLIIAMIINFFLNSSPLAYAISIISVIVFVGLTAFDTQNIKRMYDESDESDLVRTKAIYGALELYLDFINLFIALLRFTGNRK